MKIKRDHELFHKSNTGSQPKWRIGDTWYKQDDHNYEGLAETIVSDLLKKSNVERYAVYEPEWIRYKGKTSKGCGSGNFLHEGEELVESTELLEMHGMGHAAKDEPASIQDPEGAIKEFLAAVGKITGLGAFDTYLTKMFELDRIILNADRHFGNITVLRTPGGYDYAPFFDHGRSLALRDGLWKGAEEIIELVEARPFSRIFARQTKILEALSGGKRFRTSYGMDDLRLTLDRCSPVYPDKILRRAERIFAVQAWRNMDYFRGEESRKILEGYKEEIERHMAYSLDIRFQDGDLLIKPVEESGVSLLVHPSGSLDVVRGGRTLSVDETIVSHSGIIPLYRDVLEILRKRDSQ